MSIEHYFLLLIAMTCLYGGMVQLWQAGAVLRAWRWPQAPGEFQKLDWSEEGLKRLVESQFSYQYVVNGVTYTNNACIRGKVTLVDLLLMYPAARRLAQGLPRVNVYYNPDQPSASCLITHLPVGPLVKAFYWLTLTVVLGWIVREGGWSPFVAKLLG